MLKGKDIMTREVVSVRGNASVEEALELLLENKISGIPVVEEDMTLVGIVTEKDLLRLFYGPEARKKKTVENFMTQPAVYFDENESLDDICRCLLEVAFRRVPVTKKGKVVGIVSRPDVLKYVLSERVET
ncbi:MAG: CBS domain-containing protein [Planctomycetota bacterium]